MPDPVNERSNQGNDMRHRAFVELLVPGHPGKQGGHDKVSPGTSEERVERTGVSPGTSEERVEPTIRSTASLSPGIPGKQGRPDPVIERSNQRNDMRHRASSSRLSPGIPGSKAGWTR